MRVLGVACLLAAVAACRPGPVRSAAAQAPNGLPPEAATSVRGMLERACRLRAQGSAADALSIEASAVRMLEERVRGPQPYEACAIAAGHCRSIRSVLVRCVPVLGDARLIENLGRVESCALAPGELREQLANPSALAAQARVVPHFAGGGAVGFKIFAIQPGSLYARLGFQNGDVVRGLNGVSMVSPDKAIEAYEKLKRASTLEVDFERNGRAESLRCRIR